MSYKNRHPSAPSPGSPNGVFEQVLLHPEMDRIFESLGARHRRLILLLLKDGIVERKADVIVRGNSDAERFEVELVHTHLPKLEDAGYIEWDRTTDEISKGPRFGEIEPLLELIETHADELPPDWP